MVIVPFPIIEEAIELLKSDEIVNCTYDHKWQKIIGKWAIIAKTKDKQTDLAVRFCFYNGDLLVTRHKSKNKAAFTILCE